MAFLIPAAATAGTTAGTGAAFAGATAAGSAGAIGAGAASVGASIGAGAAATGGSLGAAALGKMGASIGAGSASSSWATYAAMAAMGLGTYQQYLGYQQGGEFAYKSSLMNAQQYEWDAWLSGEKSKLEAAQLLKQGDQLLSAQRAGYGTSGIKANTGSAIETQFGTAKEIEFDKDLILWGGTINATKYQNAAAMERWKGRSTRSANNLMAGTSLLTGASRFYSTGKQYGIYGA